MSPRADYALEVDFDNDLSFETAGDDVTSDAVADGIKITRGRDQARLLAGAKAGSLDAVLKNNAAAYDPGTDLKAGRPLRLTATFSGTTYSLFQGRVDVPEQLPLGRGSHFVKLRGIGSLSRLAGAKISTALYEDIPIDEALGHVLDAAGWRANLEGHILGTLDNVAGYWRLGEESGDALDSSGNGNDGAVTLGAGTRNAKALEDGGDGSLLYDALATLVSIPDAAPIQNIWDGGGSIFFMFNVASDGEGSASRLADKLDWRLATLAEAAGLVRLDFTVGFDSSPFAGIWQTAVDIPIDTTIIGVLTYDSDATGNNPTLYLWDGSAFSTRTVGSGLTETSSPAGTRNSDAGDNLTLGNNAGATRTVDGRLDEIALFGDELTATEAETLIRRAITQRELDVGQTSLAWWWVDDDDAFQAMLELLHSEGPGATIYESGDGKIVFKNRHAMITEARSTAIQTTFRSAAGATEPLISSRFAYDPGLKDVINVCTVTVVRRVAQALAEVWALGVTVSLAPNETRTFQILTSDPFTAAVPPTAGGGDFTITSGSLASAMTLDRTSGASATLSMTASVSGCTLTGLRVRAQAVTKQTETKVTNTLDTAASIDEYGEQTYRLPVREDLSLNVAQDFCNGVVTFYADPRPTAKIDVRGHVADERMTAALAREVHDRIRVIESETGVDLEFLVHTIEHRISAASQHRTIFGLEEAAPAAVDPWIWDTSKWDDGSVWWF